MRRNRLGGAMAGMDSDMISKEYDWLGWLILTAFIFTGLGYAWAWQRT